MQLATFVLKLLIFHSFQYMYVPTSWPPVKCYYYPLPTQCSAMGLNYVNFAVSKFCVFKTCLPKTWRNYSQ